MENINVQLINMDTKIPEQLIKNDDDSYTILLNARLSQESRMKSYYHALKHINASDFEKMTCRKLKKQHMTNIDL